MPGGYVSAMAERLRDLSNAIDVPLLDETVAAFYYTGSKEERAAADKILNELQNNPDTWLQVIHILRNSQNLNTKFFALQVLENAIKYRWNALPVEERERVKNYIFNVVVELSCNERSFRQEKLYINKLNLTMVQIMKHDWPSKWETIVTDLVLAAKTSETLCENCIAIFKLLSEEVFDFSRGDMTQQKANNLKQSLKSEFQCIHELFLYVLSTSQRIDLIRATLATLHAFLSWIPLAYIFESPLLKTLLNFLYWPPCRYLTLQCLKEVAALQFSDVYDTQFINMYTSFMMKLQVILPSGANIPHVYAYGSSEDQAFFRNLALFITSVFKAHIHGLESNLVNRTALISGLEILIGISNVYNPEVFKICLDYWHLLVLELFGSKLDLDNPQAPIITVMNDGIGSPLHQRRQLYSGQMSRLRTVMILRMARPEEVLIVEDEDGNIVYEPIKDNDLLVHYKIMRETLIYLTHLDKEDTENQMLILLRETREDRYWYLNTLCWAIGSISGSMTEEQEYRFLVVVVRDLLNLCNITKRKHFKAFIATDLMYVVRQYPRFLRAHWNFLRTVLKKLFDFMHETHPGVQEMACYSFLKIARECKRKFVIIQVGESEPFVSQLLSNLENTTADLKRHQILSFYESVACMIQAETDATKRDEYLRRLMELPNQHWAEIIGHVSQSVESVDILAEEEVIGTYLSILQTNTSVARSLGTHFLPQLSLIFVDMLTIYRIYSELISTNIEEGGPNASRHYIVKLLRLVRRETLKLIGTFLDKAENQPHRGKKQFLPPMMNPIFGDYSRNVPEAREPEVLSLFALLVNKYKAEMVEDVPRIFEAVFLCTLKMINKNFVDYPEHRLNFFSLLHAIATHCFQAIHQLSAQQLELVMDSIFWAIRHTERNIAETGHIILLEMLKNFQASEFCNQFHRIYFLQIEQEIFADLTNRSPRGIKLHVQVLRHLFCLVDSGSLTEPLWDASTVSYGYPNNSAYVCEFTINFFVTSFSNLSIIEVTQFVSGLFDSKDDPSTFKNHVRDFLVQFKGSSS